ncbi:MAG TPA: hypothetical protein VHA70_11540 [Bauldia sp.]|nr:hypothetical protein [Bauldia sp.]
MSRRFAVRHRLCGLLGEDDCEFAVGGDHHKSRHRIHPDDQLMMAARKGRGLSDSDAESLIEDVAELKRLERDHNDG